MDFMLDVQTKAPRPRDPPQCPTQQPAGPWSSDSPGHYKELVDLLIHKWVMRFPHLGLQFRLITAILLTYGEQVLLSENSQGCERVDSRVEPRVCLLPRPQVLAWRGGRHTHPYTQPPGHIEPSKGLYIWGWGRPGEGEVSGALLLL